MRRRKRIIITWGLAGLAAGAGFLIWFGYQVLQVPKQAYAVWWTADLVIEHMEKHDGAWPRSWDELRTTSEQAYKGTISTNLYDGTVVAEFRPRDTIVELQHLVEIDWKANPIELKKAEFRDDGKAPFWVIWLKNGKNRHYVGREPNEMILGYLKQKARQAEQGTPVPPANVSP